MVVSHAYSVRFHKRYSVLITIFAVATIVISLFITITILLAMSFTQSCHFFDNQNVNVHYRIDSILYLGVINKNGEFMIRQIVESGSFLSVQPVQKTLFSKHVTDSKNVYEYRSKMLVIGRVERGEYFVPQIGSKIISIDDYVFTSTSIPIYNLPGRFSRTDKNNFKVRFFQCFQGSLFRYLTHRAIEPKFKSTNIQSVFTPSDRRKINILRDNHVIFGSINERGEYLQNSKQLLSSFKEDQIRDLKLQNTGSMIEKLCYEYRSGSLVPGKFSSTGAFNPHYGMKIIDFKKYDFSPEAPPIWNLPGENKIKK